jgi:hypothetical protein
MELPHPTHVTCIFSDIPSPHHKIEKGTCRKATTNTTATTADARAKRAPEAMLKYWSPSIANMTDPQYMIIGNIIIGRKDRGRGRPKSTRICGRDKIARIMVALA